MLDSETKARIDSARDILVGKVPDPKSQVEQITIALIYKFMNDMDRQSEDLGGRATFFSGEFKKYAWNQLLDNRYGGHERLLLYAEGIEKMNENKNIPQLFRDIFRGVFLPYRDPETLNLFLKEINGFTYDHSERLGDAYEYLLSVMDSQGGAGQFRTPRHIIHFMVQVIDPQKHETILDPACATAGFLISSYKHILTKNTKDTPGDLLSADDRGRLMTNFCGYDISPDMVRLSRVNLYLHGFANPRIYEYDTLTSEERWDERSDIIMANPPFMTPKGGIRPHNRFSIKATRSEVLFVDYIAEHLNPGGRAAVIVPEGIIFQSQNAYKKLRRMLVENYLWAVVSLPAGVFNPYSGVKTSILFLDRKLAKRMDKVLFVKVENDGFDLGAQRRPIDKNDLPEALKILIGHKEAQTTQENGMSLCVPRKRLLDNPDCNLSGDRYRRTGARRRGNWPVVSLADVASIGAGDSAPQDGKYFVNGTVPFYRTSDVGVVHISSDFRNATDLVNEFAISTLRLTIWPAKTILFPKSGASTFLNHRVMLGRRGCVANHLATICADETKALPDYLFHVLCRIDARKLTEDQNYPSLRLGDLESIEFPLPPLAEQERIVTELEGYRKIIDGARQVIANYKPTIRIDSKWDMVRIEDVCSIKRGRFSYRPRNAPQFYGGPYPFMQTGDVVKSEGGPVSHTQTLNELGLSVSKLFSPPAVLITIAANIGDTGLLTYPACFPDSVVALIPNERVEVKFLELVMRDKKTELSDLAPQAAQKNINVEILRVVEIPLPPLATQRGIVASVDAEQALVESNRKLIEIFEAKIKAKLDEIWGEPNGAT